MKSSSLLTLFFFLLASLTVGHDLVRDAGGSPLYPGKSYYIVPGFSRPINGGGVVLGRTGNYKCPATVLQDYSNKTSGLPVKFFIPGISILVIYSDTPLFIQFKDRPDGECPELNSTQWAFISSDKNDDFVPLGVTWIGIDHGGADRNKTLLSPHGMFRVQMYDEESYKLVFCFKFNRRKPTHNLCHDVVTLDDPAETVGRRLILNNTVHKFNPYPVVFIPWFNRDA